MMGTAKYCTRVPLWVWEEEL